MGSNKADDEMENLRESVYSLSEAVPRSVIVFGPQSGFDALRMYREMAWRLWDKYIRSGAEFEINVAYSTRNACAGWMRNGDHWLDGNVQAVGDTELFHIFDHCISVCFSFCSHSFTRFKTMPEYQ